MLVHQWFAIINSNERATTIPVSESSQIALAAAAALRNISVHVFRYEVALTKLEALPHRYQGDGCCGRALR